MAAILPPKRSDAPMSTSTMIEASTGRPRRTGCYIERVIPGPLIAEIAGLVGEPARATMLSALLDGRALTATELAYAARVTPQTASTHVMPHFAGREVCRDSGSSR